MMYQSTGSQWRTDKKGWKTGIGPIEELMEPRLAYSIEPDPEYEKHKFEAWRAAETELIERRKQKLRRQNYQLQQERQQLEIDRESFKRQQEYEANRHKKEEQLLEMKRQILEDELYKLAEEKRLFEQRRSFYERVDTYERTGGTTSLSVQGEMFFVGVNSSGALKKRYKDLLKIYHPDNSCGDTNTIQVINREYQKLLEKMA